MSQVLAGMTHLAEVSTRKGDQEQALMLHQQVLAGYAAIGHPLTERGVANVVGLLQQMGR